MNEQSNLNKRGYYICFFWFAVIVTGIGCSTSNQLLSDQQDNVGDEILELNQFSKITFKIYKTGHLRIDGNMNGQPIRLIVDTGSSKSFLESRYARRFNVPIELSNETASGIGGQITQLSFAKITLLDFETFEIRNWSFGLMNLNHINRSLINAGVESVDGIIGADLLQYFNCVIDYKNEVIYFKKN